MPDNMPYFQMMGLPGHCCPMMEAPYQELESMYPKVYHTVYPHVKHHCDMMEANYGIGYNPTCEQIKEMADDIQRKVEVSVDVDISFSRDDMERQMGFGGRRLLNNLITILLLRQLIDRRRPYYPVYPGYYGGYSGYGGYGFPGY